MQLIFLLVHKINVRTNMKSIIMMYPNLNILSIVNNADIVTMETHVRVKCVTITHILYPLKMFICMFQINKIFIGYDIENDVK